MEDVKMPVKLPSDRSFGWTFTVVFALVALFHPWLMVLVVALAAVTLLRAHWLAPLKRAWMKLGELMHHVVSPVILGVIFFGVFTPIGWVMRRAGRDTMARSWDAAAKTYWVNRAPPGPSESSFRNMF
jgi:hypothetical protein